MNKEKEIILAIIISYQSNKALYDSINDLEKSKLTGKIDLKIVVIDGGTVKKSINQLKKRFSKITFITRKENLGVGKSFNLGIDFGTNQKVDYLFLLNADIRFEKDYLVKTYKKIQLNNNIGAVSGKVLFNTNPPKILFAGGKLDPKIGSTIHYGVGEVDKGQYNNRSTEILNCPILIKREVIEQVGKFREDYFMYYEDTDFYYRVRKAGYSLVVEPAAKAYTDYADEDGQSISLMKKHYYNSKNLLFFIKNNFKFLDQIVAYTYILRNVSLLFRDLVDQNKRKEAYFKLLGVKDFLLGIRGYKEIH